MATVRVQPLADGVDQRSSWEVSVNGQQVSTHVKKSAAKRTADQKATDGDTVVIKGSNGQILDRRRHRGSTSSSDDDELEFKFL